VLVFSQERLEQGGAGGGHLGDLLQLRQVGGVVG